MIEIYNCYIICKIWENLYNNSRSVFGCKEYILIMAGIIFIIKGIIMSKAMLIHDNSIAYIWILGKTAKKHIL